MPLLTPVYEKPFNDEQLSPNTNTIDMYKDCINIGNYSFAYVLK
jgi:hypothetical protein